MPNPVAPPNHYVSPGETTAAGLLASHGSALSLAADPLLALGAVYLNRRRLLANAPVHAGDVLRVHPNPRRFPTTAIDWPSRLVHEDDECLVVEKPAGIPVHPTCDNARENVVALLEAHFSVPLWICHRLDIATQGLVVLAKTATFCRDFNRWVLASLVKKRYRALVLQAPAVGKLVHYMAPGDRAPHLVSSASQEGWKPCLLDIESAVSWGPWWEVEMTLGTGRHHQIRAQLAALGLPVLGDDLYGSVSEIPSGIGQGECIALQAFELNFPDGRKFQLPRRW